MKIRLKNTKGITLIALVITIIIVLILAGTTMNMITSQDGILNKTIIAKERLNESVYEEIVNIVTQTARINEDGKIDNDILKKELDKQFGTGKYVWDENNMILTVDGKIYAIKSDGTVKEKVSELEKSQGKVLSTTETKTVKDEYGNEVRIPAGFKITYDADNVTQGVVIEDVAGGDSNSIGNQFVWIPLGKIYTDKSRTESEVKEIKLARYIFDKDGNIIKDRIQETAEGKIGTTSGYYFTEEKNIDSTFVASAKENKGYYIGRYEAGDSTATKSNKERNNSTEGILVCKAGQQVYNYITKENAKIKSENMYTEKTFKSDLINSFAWDTAILFEQIFDDRENKSIPYSQETGLTYGKPKTTGTSGDKICNIYDMAGNVLEWSTEKYSNNDTPCVNRGGRYINNDFYTSSRTVYKDNANITRGFRPILYL